MPCIVVTRNGRGDLWKFKSARVADEHPITQYGDAIVTGPEDIPEQWNRLSVLLLARTLDDELADRLQADLARLSGEYSKYQKMMELYRQTMWDTMCSVASEPPVDETSILQIIKDDRKMSKEAGNKPTASATVPKEAKTKAPKTPKEPVAPKDIQGNPLTTVLDFGTDNEGKKYGADNNPKKAASKSAARFGYYKSGGTMQDYIDAGVAAGEKAGAMRADIGYDLTKGFIVVKGR